MKAVRAFAHPTKPGNNRDGVSTIDHADTSLSSDFIAAAGPARFLLPVRRPALGSNPIDRTRGNSTVVVLIRGGTIVNHDHSRRADVLVRDGAIAAIEPTSTRRRVRR